MSKPTVANSRWDTNGTNMTAPSSGQRDTGIVASAAAVSSYINYLLNQVYLWFSFLDPLFGSDGGYLGPTNVHVKLAGTGAYKHGARTMFLHGASGMVNNDPTAVAAEWAIAETGLTVLKSPGATILYQVPLEPGRRITAVIAHITTSGNAGSRINHVEEGTAANPGDTTVIDQKTSTTISTLIALDALNGDNSIVNYTLLAAKLYQLQVALKTDDELHTIEIQYDYP